MKQKIRLVLVPVVIIALGFIVVYTFLNWLLIIKLGILNPQEILVELWLPLLLPFIPVWLWLRPRLKLLKLERKGKDNTFGYCVIAMFAVGAPSIIAQMYMQTATGKLTSLNTIKEISSQPPAMYYTIRRYYIDKENAGISYTSDVGGKYNRDLNLHIYIACPIYDTDQESAKVDPKEEEAIDTPASTGKILIMLDGTQIDSAQLTEIPPADVASISVLKGKGAIATYGKAGANGVLLVTTKKEAKIRYTPPRVVSAEVPKAWLCTQYSKRIRNGLSNEEKETHFHAFYDESIKKFDEARLKAFVYLKRTGNNTAHLGYMGAIAKTDLAVKNEPAIILEPVFTPYAERNGSKLMWVFITLGVGVLVFFLLLIKPAFKNAGAGETVEVTEGPGNQGEGLKMLLPQKTFFITPLIAYANIFIFLLMVLPVWALFHLIQKTW